MSVIRNLWSQCYQGLKFKSTWISKDSIHSFFLVIHIAIVLISCNSATQQDEKTILRYNSPTGITSLDPAFSRTQENIRTVNQLFNGLLTLDENLEIKPCIAKKWSVSPDAKTYTFILRKDVLFHNDPVFEGGTRNVVASDFVYSFNRIIDPSVASDGAWIFNGTIAAKDPFEAINDSTFQIKLLRPFTPLLSMLTMAYCYVVPQEAVEHYGDKFGKHPVGTGPFAFANWASGIKLNLIKNNQYFESTPQNPIPKLDALSISFIQSKQSELLEFMQGKLDLFTGLESSFKDEILTSDGLLKEKFKNDFLLKKSPFLNTEYLAFNLEDQSSPISDVNFRKAIHHCIDRKAMITYLRNGVGIPADGGFTPIGLPAYRSQSSEAYNIELAKKYLSQSSKTQNKPLKLTTTPNYLDLCILIQKNCSEIGIEVKIDVIPSSILKQQKSAGDLSFFRSSWIADYPDGENYMACFYGLNKAPNGPNYTRMEDESFDKYYLQLLSENDPDKRAKLFTRLEEILTVNQPYALLFYDESIWIKHKYLDEIGVNGLNHLDLKQTQILN